MAKRKPSNMIDGKKRPRKWNVGADEICTFSQVGEGFDKGKFGDAKLLKRKAVK